LLPPPVPDDDGAPWSSTLAEVIEAIEDSFSARADVVRERFFRETRTLAWRSVLSIGAIVSLGAAWLAVVVAFALWVAAAGGAILAALWVAAIHLVAAFGFTIANRPPRDDEPVPQP
jgi:hypothetical protein